MFVKNPDSFNLPSYRISPFKTDSIAHNHLLQEDDYVFSYFDDRFGIGSWTFTINGREGLNMALSNYHLLPNDIVTILTTTQNFYISSCVTKEIEKFCKWNREITSETKVILINHEFGYPYLEMDGLLSLGIPIIEDCCTTFFSQDDHGNVGKYGDLTVYSFPKIFPIQIGGLVVKKKKESILKGSKITTEEISYIKNVLSFHLRNEQQLLENRNRIYNYTVDEFYKYGFTERLTRLKKVYPTSFLFNNSEIVKDLAGLKIYLHERGIESSVFYGEDAFFVPCHQNMGTIDVDYILNCIINFKNNE